MHRSLGHCRRRMLLKCCSHCSYGNSCPAVGRAAHLRMGNERWRAGVRGLPGLKGETWATQSWWSDLGHPPKKGVFLFGQFYPDTLATVNTLLWEYVSGAHSPCLLEINLNTAIWRKTP